MKTKPFCYAPWVAVTYRGISEAKVSPCCEWNGDFFTNNIQDYVNSDLLKTIKKDMLEYNMDNISKTCVECINAEKHKVTSSREYYNYRVQSKIYVPGELNKLDYRPDNLCNLKCIMCHPMNSSLIEEELIKYENLPSTKFFDTTDVINLDLSKLKVLKLVGGEPTINKKMFYIMDHFIKKDVAKNIELQYITNCTSINSQWLNRVKKFNKHIVTISVDATDKCFDYIRHGTSWKLIEPNIKKIISTTPFYDFNIVAQAVNFAVIEDWFEYFIQYNIQHIRLSHVYGSHTFGLNVLPDHIKTEKIEYLTKFNHSLADQAITYLKNSKFNKQSFDAFWKNTEIRDKRRRVSIFDVNPIFERMKTYHE